MNKYMSASPEYKQSVQYYPQVALHSQPFERPADKEVYGSRVPDMLKIKTKEKGRHKLTFVEFKTLTPSPSQESATLNLIKNDGGTTHMAAF
ncbi:hypothetical protein [Chitiniphilus shinanonensis]|uniref:hypothetical protein n=1 Tax=Chitiniphilus shinanonensis TaxID=553088 RepID=UPI003020C819